MLLGLLGTFVTSLFVAMTLVTGSIRSEFRGLFAGLRGELSARFDAVDVRLEGVDRRLEHLDRDVQALSDRVFRDRP